MVRPDDFPTEVKTCRPLLSQVKTEEKIQSYKRTPAAVRTGADIRVNPHRRNPYYLPRHVCRSVDPSLPWGPPTTTRGPTVSSEFC